MTSLEGTVLLHHRSTGRAAGARQGGLGCSLPRQPQVLLSPPLFLSLPGEGCLPLGLAVGVGAVEGQ